MRNRPDRNGFTLIELLVVIAIIAILAAILFPVFAQARDKARQATEVSNMKQLALAMRMYSSDYDEQNIRMWWSPYTNKCNDTPARAWWQYFLKPYVKNLDVFTEPSVSNPQFLGERECIKDWGWGAGDSSYRFESGIGLNWYQPYNANEPITDCGEWGCMVPGWSYGGVSDASVARPSERVAIGSTANAVVWGPNDILAAAFPGPYTGILWSNWILAINEDPNAGTPYWNGASRHAKNMTVGYYDGHVKAVRRTNFKQANFDLKSDQ